MVETCRQLWGGYDNIDNTHSSSRGRVIQQRAESLGFSKTLGVLALMIELVSMPNRGIVTTHFRVAGRCEDAARWGLQLLTAPAK
jgi:hypothetical protein